MAVVRKMWFPVTMLEGEKCPCLGMEETSGAAVTFRCGQDPQR